MNIGIDHIAGNSRLIIDWANLGCSIHALDLRSWLEDTRALLMEFPQTPLIHILCEFNGEADILSRRGYGATEGLIFFF